MNTIICILLLIIQESSLFGPLKIISSTLSPLKDWEDLNSLNKTFQIESNASILNEPQRISNTSNQFSFRENAKISNSTFKILKPNFESQSNVSNFMNKTDLQVLDSFDEEMSTLNSTTFTNSSDFLKEETCSIYNVSNISSILLLDGPTFNNITINSTSNYNTICSEVKLCNVSSILRDVIACRGYGECVVKSWLMDSKLDCLDGSDEDPNYACLFLETEFCKKYSIEPIETTDTDNVASSPPPSSGPNENESGGTGTGTDTGGAPGSGSGTGTGIGTGSGTGSGSGGGTGTSGGTGVGSGTETGTDIGAGTAVGSENGGATGNSGTGSKNTGTGNGDNGTGDGSDATGTGTAGGGTGIVGGTGTGTGTGTDTGTGNAGKGVVGTSSGSGSGNGSGSSSGFVNGTQKGGGTGNEASENTGAAGTGSNGTGVIGTGSGTGGTGAGKTGNSSAAGGNSNGQMGTGSGTGGTNRSSNAVNPAEYDRCLNESLTTADNIYPGNSSLCPCPVNQELNEDLQCVETKGTDLSVKLKAIKLCGKIMEFDAKLRNPESPEFIQYSKLLVWKLATIFKGLGFDSDGVCVPAIPMQSGSLIASFTIPCNMSSSEKCSSIFSNAIKNATDETFDKNFWQVTTKCDISPEVCNINATCVPLNASAYRCQCNPGFEDISGNGFKCLQAESLTTTSTTSLDSTTSTSSSDVLGKAGISSVPWWIYVVILALLLIMLLLCCCGCWWYKKHRNQNDDQVVPLQQQSEHGWDSPQGSSGSPNTADSKGHPSETPTMWDQFQEKNANLNESNEMVHYDQASKEPSDRPSSNHSHLSLHSTPRPEESPVPDYDEMHVFDDRLPGSSLAGDDDSIHPNALPEDDEAHGNKAHKLKLHRGPRYKEDLWWQNNEQQFDSQEF